MQELPAAMPDGHTAVRQSDFARPRRTLTLVLLTLAAAIVYFSSQPEAQPDPIPERKPTIYRTVCDGDCPRLMQPTRRFV